MDSIVAGLGVGDAIDHSVSNILVGVPRDHDVDLPAGLSEFVHPVGEIIRRWFASMESLQAKVTRQDNGIHIRSLQFFDGILDGLQWIAGKEIGEQSLVQPCGKPRRDRADNPDLESGDFLDQIGSHLAHGVVILQLIGPFAAHLGIGGQHRHRGSPDAFHHRAESPVEFMIAYHPGVILEFVEEVDHDLAIAGTALRGALIDVPDIDQEGVGLGRLPLFNLRRAAGQTSYVFDSFVGFSGPDVAVQVGGIEDGNGDLPVLGFGGSAGFPRFPSRGDR